MLNKYALESTSSSISGLNIRSCTTLREQKRRYGNRGWTNLNATYSMDADLLDESLLTKRVEDN